MSEENPIDNLSFLSQEKKDEYKAKINTSKQHIDAISTKIDAEVMAEKIFKDNMRIFINAAPTFEIFASKIDEAYASFDAKLKEIPDLDFRDIFSSTLHKKFFELIHSCTDLNTEAENIKLISSILEKFNVDDD